VGQLDLTRRWHAVENDIAVWALSERPMSVSAVRFYELFNSISLHLGQNKNTATELKKETFAFGSATTYVVNRNIPV